MGRGRNLIGLAFRSSFIWSCLSSSALAVCPTRSLGIGVEKDDNGGRRFYATEKAEALANNEDSRKLAAAEARIAARAALATQKGVPKQDNGRLRGVTEVNTCGVGNMVYVTMMVDELAVKRALSLENAMQRSLQTSPTPMPPLNAGARDADKDTFERLMETRP
jgi:hypothetical protein